VSNSQDFRADSSSSDQTQGPRAQPADDWSQAKTVVLNPDFQPQNLDVSLPQPYESVYSQWLESKGGEREKLGEELTDAALLDEMVVRMSGGNLSRDTNLPILRDSDIMRRIEQQAHDNFEREAPLLESPAWQMLQDWVEANPDGNLKQSPGYAEAVANGTPMADMTDEEKRLAVGGILNDLNAMYHATVDPRGSIFQSIGLGAKARKLASLYQPHAFDDAPAWQKFGINALEGIGHAAIGMTDMSFKTIQGVWGLGWETGKAIDTLVTGNDRSDLGMSLLRNVLEPDTPLDVFKKKWEGQENRVGIAEMVAATQHAVLGEEMDTLAAEMFDAKEKIAYSRSSTITNQVGAVLGEVFSFALGAPGAVVTTTGSAAAGLMTRGATLLSGGGKLGALGKKIVQFGGGVVGFGAAESLLMGGTNEQSYGDAFLHGMAAAPLYLAAGALGGKANKWLLHARAPTRVAQAVSGLIEGAGFGAFTDLAQGEDSLTWQVMRDPTQENLERYMEHIGVNMMAMGLFKGMHKITPYEAMQAETIRRTGMTPEEMMGKWERREEQTRDRTKLAQAKVLDPQAGWLDLMKASDPTVEPKLEAVGRELGRQGRRELVEERETGKPSLQGEVSPAVRKMFDEVVGPPDARVQPEHIMRRMIEFSKRQLQRRQVEGKEQERELGYWFEFERGGGQGKPVHTLKYDPTSREAQEGFIGPRESLHARAQLPGSGAQVLFHSHPGSDSFSGNDAVWFAAQGVGKGVPFFRTGVDTVEVMTVRNPELAREVAKSGLGRMSMKVEIDNSLYAEAIKFAEKHGKETSWIEELRAGKGDPALREAFYDQWHKAQQLVLKPYGLKVERMSTEEAVARWKETVRTGEWPGAAPEGFEAGKTYVPRETRHASEVSFEFEAMRAGAELGLQGATAGEAVANMRSALVSSDPTLRQNARETLLKHLERRWLPRAEEILDRPIPRTWEAVGEAAKELQFTQPVARGAEALGKFYEQPWGQPADLVSAEPPLGGKFRPDRRFESERQKLQAMFGRDKEANAPVAVLDRLKSISGKFLGVLKNKTTRGEAADWLDRMGFRRKFGKLGEFEERLTAENNRLLTELGDSPRMATERLAFALEPLLKVGGATEPGKAPTAEQAKARQRSVQNALEHLYLKDFIREAEAGRPLPLDLEPGAVRQRLRELKLSGEEMETVERIRGVLDHAGNQLVELGILRPGDLKPDYMPHKVVDFFDALDSFTPGRTLAKLRKGFSGYSKGREGTTRMLDTSIEALQAHLTQVGKDLAVHDYIRRNGTAIHDVMLDRYGMSGQDLTVDGMDTKTWKVVRDGLEADGVVIYDTRYGQLGKRHMATDPLAQEIYRYFEAQSGFEIPSIPELGGNVRPNPDKGIFLVPKEVANHWLELRKPSEGLLTSPLLQKARQLIGKWVKGPMLRGLGGLQAPARRARDVISDIASLYTKKELKELPSILKLAKPGGTGSRLARAHADPEWAAKHLDPSEAGLLAEMQAYGTMQSGMVGTEIIGKDTSFAKDPVLREIYPDYHNWTAKLSRFYRGDHKWVETIDKYGENLFRASLFVHERTKLLQRGLDRDAAARGADIEVGRVLVNYKHNTPFEANGLNTFAFPFYTWTRHQLTSVGAEFLRSPGPTAAKLSFLASLPVIWNQMFAPDEESALVQSGARVTQYPHIILPFAKDENGNSMVMAWEGPGDMFMRFFGLGAAPSKVADYLFGHGDESILMRDITAGSGESIIGQFGQDALAPWIRDIAGRTGWKSKFTTTTEELGRAELQAAEFSRPYSDLRRTLDARRSIAQKVTGYIPFFSYVDTAVGEPQRKRATEFYAGRQQRVAAQLSSDIQRWLPALHAAYQKRNIPRLRSIVDEIWDDWSDQISASGYTKRHIVSRVANALENRIEREQLKKLPGRMSSRVYGLSEEQRHAFLREMGVLREGSR
jgi:hypothetical protein